MHSLKTVILLMPYWSDYIMLSLVKTSNLLSQIESQKIASWPLEAAIAALLQRAGEALPKSSGGLTVN